MATGASAAWFQSMIACARVAIYRFFGNLAQSSPEGDPNRWAADDQMERLYFKIWPTKNRGHIRLMVNRMAVLDSSVCDITSINAISDKLEIFEIRLRQSGQIKI